MFDPANGTRRLAHPCCLLRRQGWGGAHDQSPRPRMGTQNPGNTGLVRSVLEHPETGPALLDRIPMRRFAQVRDVTGAVLYLAPDYAGIFTGTSIMVDGGWTAG